MTRIKIPFASEGDKVLIPNDITLDGSVNFKQGYTPRYAENPAPVEEGGSPTAKVIERPEMNYLFNILSENIKKWQEQVYPDWISNDGDGIPFAYSKGVIVRYTDGKYYLSKIDNNTQIPTGENWEDADIKDVKDVKDFVTLTGNQTIAGVKTFSSSPIVPTPTTATQAANKYYVDISAANSTTGRSIGEPFAVWTHLSGAQVPNNSGSAKFVKLTANDSFNNGLLTSETVTGTAPLVVATAVISLADSPMNGQKIHLINTEEAIIRPRGVSGELQFDQMQRIMGGSIAASSGAVTKTAGALQHDKGPYSVSIGLATGSGTGGALTFNSASSPNARASATTGGETRPKNVSATYYMRIA